MVAVRAARQAAVPVLHPAAHHPAVHRQVALPRAAVRRPAVPRQAAVPVLAAVGLAYVTGMVKVIGPCVTTQAMAGDMKMDKAVSVSKPVIIRGSGALAVSSVTRIF